MTKPIIYLACPYSHEKLSVRTARFELANHIAAHLVDQGQVVFSPISMTHPIDLAMSEAGESQGSDYWVSFDEAFMNFCSSICVIEIPGWLESGGVRREIDWFREQRSVEPNMIKPGDFLDLTNPLFTHAFE